MKKVGTVRYIIHQRGKSNHHQSTQTLFHEVRFFNKEAIKRKPIFTKSKTPTHDNTRRVKNVGKSFEFTDCIAGQTA